MYNLTRAKVSVSNCFHLKKGEEEKTSRRAQGAPYNQLQELLSLQPKHSSGGITELTAIFQTKSVSERIRVSTGLSK